MNRRDKIGQNGLKFSVDELLNGDLVGLMRTTAVSENLEAMNNIDDLEAEYSALHNTIDELNRCLDIWDSRNNQLRSEIQEVLSETVEANDNPEEEEVPSEEEVNQNPEEEGEDDSLEAVGERAEVETSTREDLSVQNPLGSDKDDSPASS